MSRIYALCKNDGKNLISAADFVRSFPEKTRLSEEEYEKIFESLKEDDYADALFSKRKGEKMYLFTLRTKGIAFLRERENRRRAARLLVARSVVSALIAFFVGLLLRRLFR